MVSRHVSAAFRLRGQPELKRPDPRQSWLLPSSSAVSPSSSASTDSWGRWGKGERGSAGGGWGGGCLCVCVGGGG